MVNSNVVAKIKSSDLKKLGAYDVVRVSEKGGNYVWQKDGLDKADIEYKENQSYFIKYTHTNEGQAETSVTIRIDCALSSLRPFLKNFPHKVDGSYAYYYQNDVEDRIEDLVYDKLDTLPKLETTTRVEFGRQCKRELLDILKEQGLRVIRCSVVKYDIKTPDKIPLREEASLEQKVSAPKKCRDINDGIKSAIDEEALKIVLMNPAYTASGSGDTYYEGWKTVLSEAYTRGCDDFSKVRQFVNESEIEGILSARTKQMREAC